MREKQQMQKRKIEKIKEKKLGTLGDLGIDAKYKAELAKKKVT